MAVRLTNGLYVGPITKGSSITTINAGSWTDNQNAPGVLNVSTLGLSMSAMSRDYPTLCYLKNGFPDWRNWPENIDKYYYQRLYNDSEVAILYNYNQDYNNYLDDDPNWNPSNYRVFEPRNQDFVKVANNSIQSIQSSLVGGNEPTKGWTLLLPGQYSSIYRCRVEGAQGAWYSYEAVSLGFLYLGGIVAHATVV